LAVTAVTRKVCELIIASPDTVTRVVVLRATTVSPSYTRKWSGRGPPAGCAQDRCTDELVMLLAARAVGTAGAAARASTACGATKSDSVTASRAADIR
jgi:hypothetical protein